MNISIDDIIHIIELLEQDYFYNKENGNFKAADLYLKAQLLIAEYKNSVVTNVAK